MVGMQVRLAVAIRGSLCVSTGQPRQPQGRHSPKSGPAGPACPATQCQQGCHHSTHPPGHRCSGWRTGRACRAQAPASRGSPRTAGRPATPRAGSSSRCRARTSPAAPPGLSGGSTWGHCASACRCAPETQNLELRLPEASSRWRYMPACLLASLRSCLVQSCQMEPAGCCTPVLQGPGMSRPCMRQPRQSSPQAEPWCAQYWCEAAGCMSAPAVCLQAPAVSSFLSAVQGPSLHKALLSTQWLPCLSGARCSAARRLPQIES